VRCGFCSARNASLFRWKATVSSATLAKVAAELGLGPWVLRIEAAGPEVAPWEKARLTGERASATLGAGALRAALHRAGQSPRLPSHRVDDVRTAPEGVALSGRGFGHGVGLCQVGAAEMAARGKSRDEILAHYYPGATVEPAAPLAVR
jgi:stage II sporulation protein D